MLLRRQWHLVARLTRGFSVGFRPVPYGGNVNVSATRTNLSRPPLEMNNFLVECRLGLPGRTVATGGKGGGGDTPGHGVSLCPRAEGVGQRTPRLVALDTS